MPGHITLKDPITFEPLTSLQMLELRVVQACELFLIIVSVFTTITVLRIFYKTPLLHRNLLGLLAMMAIEYSVVMSSRAVMLVLSFDNEDYLNDPNLVVKTGVYSKYEWFRVGGCACILFDIVCISLERAMATVYLETYEKNTSNTFLILSLVFQTSLAAMFTILFFKDMLSYIAIIVIGIGICGFILTAFVLSHRVNMRRYKHSLSRYQTPKYTLSERFQLSENIRAFKILKRVMFFIVITNFFIILGVIFVTVFHQNLSMLIFRAVFNIIVIVYSICVPIIFVTSVEVWRLKYFKFFEVARDKLFCRRRRVEDSSFRKLQHLRSSNGNQMGFDLEREKDIAFAQLNRSWK